ncbi:MAG: winged helix-turn-helix domain-containing protein [Acidobacteriia bacterium]|nr:winged helix-turn-helix domain-containing protein [Terriglobia bacterium]
MRNTVRFDSYEVDLPAGQLYKHGTKISLRDKSFQALAALLEHPGEVVTREDLCRQLWREEVFVDFDNNLNTAIARLREALGDSADHPRFIETLPKRGYRFLASVFELPRTPEKRTVDRARLVVLPFLNLSGDPAQEYFSDAITDEIITGVASVAPEQLAVIARTTAMHYKGSQKDVSRIGRELGVDYVVEGGVHRIDDQVGINIQLIRVSDQTHVFARKYEAQPHDVFSMQSRIAEAIASHLDIPGLAVLVRIGEEVCRPAQVTPQEKQIPRLSRRVDLEVYDATLKGKATIEYATREGQVHQAIELFQEAIDRDPTYAPAWAGLGEALWYLAATGFEFVAPTDVRDKAVAAAEKALELDETLPDAHKARAVIAIDAEWDLVKAQHHFDTVLQLQPSHATAHNLYGQILAAPLLRFDEAHQHFDRARELDPLSPWNDANLLGWWIHQGRPERTLEEGERAGQRNPTLWIIRCLMGFAHLLLEHASQAVPQFETALGLLQPDRPPAVLAPLGLAYALADRPAEALRILAELERRSEKRYVSPFHLAVVHSGLGRTDEAFQLLDRALDQRTPYLICCTPNDGNSVALRHDPRWKLFSDRLRRLVRLPPSTPDPYS